MRLATAFSSIAMLVLGAAVPAVARADTQARGPQDPDVSRLLQAKGATLKWNEARAEQGARYGHAEVLVDAPLAKVWGSAVDFARYRELHPKFSSARVIAKEADHVDVYLRLPVKLGPVKLEQWQVMRFGPPRSGPASFVVEGQGVRGNLKQGHLIVTGRSVDEQHTLVKVDLLLVSSLPAPQSVVDEELRDAAADLANGFRTKAQGDGHVVTTLSASAPISSPAER